MSVSSAPSGILAERLARPLRFATQAGGAPTGAEWIAKVRRYEQLGYGTVATPDHVVGGAWAPMLALAAAAAATSAIRLGTLVIDNDFRNPVLLAREVAALDVMSDGRFEFGIGAGWLDRDYQGLGIPFDRGRIRVRRMAEAIVLMKRLFTEEAVSFAGDFYRTDRAECRPACVQRPHPPILVAGGGPEILKVCGEHADIVAIVASGAGARPLRPADVSVARAREQIAIVDAAAGERAASLELSMFVDVTLTDDRSAAIRDLAERHKADPATLEASMYRGIGTLAEIREHILEVRAQLGITYFCLRGPDIEALGPIVQELTGLSG